MTDTPPEIPPRPTGYVIPVEFMPGPCNVRFDDVAIDGETAFAMILSTPQTTTTSFWKRDDLRGLWNTIGQKLSPLHVASPTDVPGLLGPKG